MLTSEVAWVTRVAGWGALLVASGCASLPTSGGSLRRPATPLIGQALAPIHAIVVDAGHGGHDPGAMYHGLREKDLTLDIARRLKTELQGHGLSVTMTRNSDEFIVLSRRPNIANRIPADLFVSVHVNANRNRRVSGVEIYYPRESVVEAGASFPPFVQSEEVALPTTTIKRILWDMVLSRARAHSVRLASHICRAMRDRLGVPCRWVHGARFLVLRESRMPAVLVEVGYISNRPEASRLADASYRQTVAQAITDGVIAYIQEVGLQHI